jgi:hypothetical protein
MQPFLLNTDSDPQNQPDKTSRLNINVNINSELGSITNEDGNYPLFNYPTLITPGATCIGKIPLSNGSIVLFSVIEGLSRFKDLTPPYNQTDGRYCRGEIGILSPDNSYRVLIRDKVGVTDFNWDLNTQIQGTYKINSDNTFSVYWVDFRNPLRYINVDTPEPAVDLNFQCTNINEFNKLFVLKPFEQFKINLDSVQNGGNLKSGVYYVLASYADENFNETNLSFPSNPISIVNELTPYPIENYDGCEANTLTGKSFTISFPSDITFPNVKLYVISKINQVLSAYDLGYFVNTSSTFTQEILSLDDVATTSTDILINKITWIAKTITQLDNRLYIGNLKEPLKTNLQPWINNILVTPYMEQTQNRNSFNTSFHSEVEIFTKRCFQYDEVYALYATVVYKDGTESEAYHIPGRQATSVSYDGTAGTPVITGGVEVVDSNGLRLRFDENERLNTIQTTYRLNENDEFCATAMPIQNEGGTYNTNTNVLTYNTTIPNLPLSNNKIALLKQYNPGGTESYYYVKTLTTTVIPNLPVSTYSHTTELVKAVNNCNTGLINLWNILTDAEDPGIYDIPKISNNYVTNGLSATDISPAGEMYNIYSGAKTFHTFDCAKNAFNNKKLGFWENEDETYTNNADWDVKNSNSTITNSFRGQKIRHHKMPGPEWIQNALDVNYTTSLGLKISNIIFPKELQNEISKIKIYYAKRTNNNRSILGQSLLIHDFYVYSVNRGSDLNNEGVFSTSFNNPMTFYSIFQGGTGSNNDRQMLRQLNRVRMSPFDICSSNLDISQATHLKAFKKVKSSGLTYWGSVGTSAWNNNSSNNPKAADARFKWEENTVENQKKSSYIRRFANAKLTESLPIYNPDSTLLTGSGNHPPNKGQLDFTYNTTHYLGETCVSIETVNNIEADCYTQNATLNFISSANSPYVSYALKGNICSFKLNMYPNYYNEELVDTGYIETLQASAFSTVYNPSTFFYGGDTFQSSDAYRSTSDLVYAFNMGGFGSTFYTAMQFITLYSNVIVESISNINYRHQGPGIYDIYYPKSDYVSVLKVPLLPNGFPNYYAYNKDYTSVNDLKAPGIHSLLSTKIDTFPTRIARSAVDNPESVQDNLRIFLPNEYTDVEKSKGEIINITNFGNSLVIQHTHSLKRTATKDRMKTDSSEAYLGAGDLFDYPAKDIILTDTGYGGLKHQFSSITNQYGVFYVDVNSASIFLYGEKLAAISDNGIKIFALNNLKLNFEVYLKELIFSLTDTYVQGSTYVKGKSVVYNNTIYIALNTTTTNPTNYENWQKVYNYDNFYFDGQDSIFYGYISGYDPLYKRFLLTKKDIVVTTSFTNNFKGYFNFTKFVNDWTTSSLFMYEGKLLKKQNGPGTDIIKFYNNGATECYGAEIFFNNFTYFTENRFTLGYYPEYDGFVSWYENSQDNYFSNQLKFWSQHNKVAFEQNKKEYPYLLSYGASKAIENITNSIGAMTVEPIFNTKEVDRLMSIQWKTKALDVASNEEVLKTFDSLQAYDSYQISKLANITNKVTSRNVEGYWSSNDFRDYTLNNSLKVVDNSVWYRPFVQANIALTKHWTKLKRLVDYWFGIRFKYALASEEALEFFQPGSYIYFNGLMQNNISSTADITLYVNDVRLVKGAILKLNCQLGANQFTIYCVIVYGTYTYYGVKFYNTLPYTSTLQNTSILSANLITKKPKLNLLDASSIKIKNIR